MNANELTERIGNLIAENRIDQAIREMKLLFANSPKLREVLLQSARHKEIVEAINNGTVSYEHSSVAKNQVRYALLRVLTEVEEQSADPGIAGEISRFEISGNHNLVQQHSGTGDNIGRDKVITTNYKMRVGILVVTILLAAAAGILFPFMMPKPKPLSGFVISSADKPVDRAKVVYSASNGVELESFTDVSGYFQFEDINTKDNNAFTLKAFVEGRQARLDTFGSETGLSALQLRLPPGLPPFDISYYDLKMEAITWLVLGTRSWSENDKTWEKTFRGKPFVSNNALLKELRLMADRFGEPWRTEYNDDLWRVDFRSHYAKNDVNEQSEWASLIEADGWKRNGNRLSAADLKQIITQAPEIDRNDWNTFIAAHEYFDNQLHGASIQPGPEDLASLHETGHGKLSFYRYVGREGFPEDFLEFKIVDMVEDGCTGGNVEMDFPKMTVQVAVVENNTSTGIEIDSFYLLTHPDEKLRTLERDNEMLAGATPVKRKLFPRHRLAAGEKLMIPLRIVFESPDPGYNEEPEPKQYWVYGPSIKIAQVDVGIERFAFREKDPNSLLIYNGSNIGSCPYAYTFNHSMNAWQLENHILYNINSAEKETFDTIALSQFDGRLLIRELDPEISHIDLIEVHHIAAGNGAISRFRPVHPPLQAADGIYHIMNQGDSVYLEFENFNPQNEGRYFLISRGYYEVYEQL